MLGDAAISMISIRLYETVRKEKGKIDILFASAGRGELAAIGEVTEEHFGVVAAIVQKFTLSRPKNGLLQSFFTRKLLAPTCRLEVNHVDTFSGEQEVVTLNTLRIGPIV